MENPGMAIPPACLDCTDMTGAPPTRQPHPQMEPAGNDDAKRSQFQCAACGYRWVVDSQGWASVWEQLARTRLASRD